MAARNNVALAFLLLFSYPLFLHAQSVGADDSELLDGPTEQSLPADLPAQVGALAQTGGISITISPQNPEPGSNVRLSASSYSADLDRSDIGWYVNGNLLGEGPGLKEAGLIAGELGSTTEVVVFSRSRDGTTASGRISIQPAAIDLLWESNSFVPPFYRGRTLPSAGTYIRVHAVPHFLTQGGEEIPEKELMYTWRRNGYVVQSVSGRGKSVAVFSSPVLFGTDTIDVTAESVDGFLLGEVSAVIPSTEPVLVLYKNHPLFGIMYEYALGAQTGIADSEMTFSVVPYFADVMSPNDPRLIYSWRVNQRDISADAINPSELTISADQSNKRALIDLTLTHESNLVMRSEGEWGVSFSAGTGASDIFSASAQ